MTTGARPVGVRDVRLDFFRGLALWFIFINHMPANQLSLLTPRNFGLSDATEIFVFISGYTTALVYGQVFERSGFRLAAAQILHRCWTLYITYIALFFAFTAQIAYTARVLENPLFSEEMGIASYFQDPAVALTEALILKFRPVNLDVLPLYIVLLLAFPLMLPALRRHPLALLAASGALYLAARWLNWNLPTYPDGGVWYFNPFAWQFLFVLGAVFHRKPGLRTRFCRYRPFAMAAALAVLAASFLLVLSWQFAFLEAFVPHDLAEILYPISKTDLDPLRLIHFAALAYVTLRVIRSDSRWLAGPLARPVIICGRQSLYIFCTGVLLSFAGQALLVHVDSSLSSQIFTTIVGVVGMVLLARMLSWYQSAVRAQRGTSAAGKSGA